MSPQRAFVAHYKYLLNWVQHHQPPSHRRRYDPEDVLQDAYIKVEKAWLRFLPSGLNLRSWLVWIVRDCLNDRIRWEVKRTPQPHRGNTDLPDPIDSGTSPTRNLTRKELREQVQWVLQQMS